MGRGATRDNKCLLVAGAGALLIEKLRGEHGPVGSGGVSHTGILKKRAADRGSSEGESPEAGVRQTSGNSRGAQGPRRGLCRDSHVREASEEQGHLPPTAHSSHQEPPAFPESQAVFHFPPLL